MDISEAKIKLLDYTDDIVIITKASPIDTPDGPEIVYVNRAFTELSQYTLDEVIGKTPRILQGTRTNRKTLKKIKCAVINNQPIHVELLNYSKDGKEYWVDFSIIYLKDNNNKLVYLGAIEKDITKLKRTQQELAIKASTDDLTEALSRSALQHFLRKFFTSFQIENEYFGILFIDIDDFKEINDTKGHSYGDKILCQLSDELKAQLRSTDKVCRYGGDEFVILLPGSSDAKSLEKKARRLLTVLKKKYNISVSIGGTIVCNDDASVNEFVERADRAMYKVKHSKKFDVNIV